MRKLIGFDLSLQLLPSSPLVSLSYPENRCQSFALGSSCLVCFLYFLKMHSRKTTVQLGFVPSLVLIIANAIYDLLSDFKWGRNYCGCLGLSWSRFSLSRRTKRKIMLLNFIRFRGLV